MKRVLSVDFYKITKEKWFFIAILGMLLVSSGFMWIQNTSMSYTVMLDRVIFFFTNVYIWFSSCSND